MRFNTSVIICDECGQVCTFEFYVRYLFSGEFAYFCRECANKSDVMVKKVNDMWEVASEFNESIEPV